MIICLQTLRYAGLSGRLGELQFNGFDVYFPGLTVIVLVLLPAVAIVAIGLFWRYARRRRARQAAEALEAAPITPEQALTRAIASASMLILYAYSVAATAFFAVVICGAIPSLRDTGGRAAHAVDVIESASASSGQFLRISGRIDMTRIALLRHGLGFVRHDVYIAPILLRTSKGGDQQRFFAEVAPDDVELRGTRASGEALGYLRHAAFPPQLVSLYRSRGIDVSRDAVVLYKSRQSRDWPYYISAIQFLGVMVLALLLVMALGWRRRLLMSRLDGQAFPAQRITRR